MQWPQPALHPQHSARIGKNDAHMLHASAHLQRAFGILFLRCFTKAAACLRIEIETLGLAEPAMLGVPPILWHDQPFPDILWLGEHLGAMAAHKSRFTLALDFGSSRGSDDKADSGQRIAFYHGATIAPSHSIQQ